MTLKIKCLSGITIETQEYPKDATSATFSYQGKSCSIEISEFINPNFLPFCSMATLINLPIVEDKDYGFEFEMDVDNAIIRFGDDYVRVLRSDHKSEVLYWTADEFIEAPEEVFGALLGAMVRIVV